MKLQVQRSILDTPKYFFQSTCCSTLEQSATKSYRCYLVTSLKRRLDNYTRWPIKLINVKRKLPFDAYTVNSVTTNPIFLLIGV